MTRTRVKWLIHQGQPFFCIVTCICISTYKRVEVRPKIFKCLCVFFFPAMQNACRIFKLQSTLSVIPSSGIASTLSFVLLQKKSPRKFREDTFICHEQLIYFGAPPSTKASVALSILASLILNPDACLFVLFSGVLGVASCSLSFFF